MELQSMTAKVLEQKQSNSNNEKIWIDHELISFEKVKNYAKFLTMPLELWMFVPVDNNGNVLAEPSMFNDFEDHYKAVDKCSSVELWYSKCKAYQQAKDNVIFEGVSYSKRSANGAKAYLIYNNDVIVSMPEGFKFNTTIESLIPYGLTITESAIKKYGL